MRNSRSVCDDPRNERRSAAAGFRPINGQGWPTSRWVIRDGLEEFITGEESDCAGENEGIDRRVRVVVSPPDPRLLYWPGEVAVLLGASLTCEPIFEPETGPRYAFNLRSSGGGQWQVESIYGFDYDRCEYLYAGRLRYYPLDQGPPGPQLCS